MNQYITIQGIAPRFLSSFHEVLQSSEAAGTGDKPPQALLHAVRWFKERNVYDVELECPLEYSDGKRAYHPDGKVLGTIFQVIGGLYPETEKVLYGALPQEFARSVEMKMKITGVTPQKLSSLFSICNNFPVRSNYQLLVGRTLRGLRVSEILYTQMKASEWKSEFGTFTVHIFCTAFQYIDGHTCCLMMGKKDGDGPEENSPAGLYAPRSVLNAIYSALERYWLFRNPYTDYDF
ncbi:MAG: hypothetical protein G01um101448_541 [Parcubacteria group bacterium Gr01-1014_48]|nr:MAG: hypothetical protein Greene041614_641 [Parcubacteria group bacterium Greene0416_14]TSC73807.1 MAG: hypothetical protein G01um101448_541 [Parcubacteria group bacterium Gr01-1014_48]TSD01075.1 MAG: hypothetical protein Greene101415_478 [Parcubacteria group bacterium Greene1014_15]TSD08062.1 MAG: hypothetical protein Greene07144_455 [Parcubacteria group bacterium Greene0714_4]